MTRDGIHSTRRAAESRKASSDWSNSEWLPSGGSREVSRCEETATGGGELSLYSMNWLQGRRSMRLTRSILVKTVVSTSFTTRESQSLRFFLTSPTSQSGIQKYSNGSESLESTSSIFYDNLTKSPSLNETKTCRSILESTTTRSLG